MANYVCESAYSTVVWMTTNLPVLKPSILPVLQHVSSHRHYSTVLTFANTNPTCSRVTFIGVAGMLQLEYASYQLEFMFAEMFALLRTVVTYLICICESEYSSVDGYLHAGVLVKC